MDKSMIGHWVVALVACGTAYVAWSKPVQKEDDLNVVMVPGAADRLTEIRWEDDSYDVVVGREGDGAMVTVTNKKAVPTAQEPAKPATAFPGTEKARDLFASMAPLRAARSIGKGQGAQLEALGLTKPSATLTLRFGDNATRVAIGNATYGSGNYYVQPEGGEIYLMPASALLPLKTGAPSLIDRNVVSVPRDRISRVVVESEGAKRELVHRDPDDRAKSFFADAAEPDTKLEQTTTWLDRVLRLRVLNAGGSGEPTSEPKLTLSLYDGRELVQELRVWEPQGEEVVVRSNRFKQPITIAKSNVEPILRDVRVVMSEGRSSP